MKYSLKISSYIVNFIKNSISKYSFEIFLSIAHGFNIARSYFLDFLTTLLKLK